MSAFEELLARKLDDPVIRAAFEDSRTRHELIRRLVELRRRASTRDGCGYGAGSSTHNRNGFGDGTSTDGNGYGGGS